MDIKSNKYNTTMWQGSTFGLSIIVKDSEGNNLDLTGFSAKMHIRPLYTSDEITETLDTETGEIVISSHENTLCRVDLRLDANRTAQIYVDLNNGIPPRSDYVYDLELTSSDDIVSKILWGNISVYGEVTR